MQKRVALCPLRIGVGGAVVVTFFVAQACVKKNWLKHMGKKDR